jgi:hypothetical protein
MSLATRCVRRLNPLSLWLWRAQPFYLEIALAVCSAWMSWALLHSPGPFHNCPALYEIPMRLLDNERDWSCVFASGAAAKAVGLTLMLWPRHRNAGWRLRCIGLAISGVAWTLFDASAVENPQSVFGITGLVMGISAWGLLLAMPAVQALSAIDPGVTSALVVPQGTRDERLLNNPLVTGAPKIWFCIGEPIEG